MIRSPEKRVQNSHVKVWNEIPVPRASSSRGVNSASGVGSPKSGSRELAWNGTEPALYTSHLFNGGLGTGQGLKEKLGQVL